MICDLLIIFGFVCFFAIGYAVGKRNAISDKIRDGSGWQYVNLTDGHICPCKFLTKEEAVKEFAKGAGDGRIVGYMQIGDVEVKR